MVDKKAFKKALEFERDIAADFPLTKPQVYDSLHTTMIAALIAEEDDNYFTMYRKLYDVVALAHMLLRGEYKDGDWENADPDEELLKLYEEILIKGAAQLDTNTFKQLRANMILSVAELGVAAFDIDSNNFKEFAQRVVVVLSVTLALANRIQKKVFDDTGSESEGAS